MKRLLGIGVVALTLFATAGCAVRVHDHFGPPPPPRGAMGHHTHDGRVWVPGYDRWTGNRYRWVEGRWVRPPRHGQVWVPGYRAQRGGVYVWIEGHWR